MDKLISLYNNLDEGNRLNRDRARNLEFLTTTKILDMYLRTDDTILDLGSGPGKYSLYYNAKGHTVHAADIVPEHIKKLEKIIDERHLKSITCSVNNATDLSSFESNAFDVVLLFGPYYHLRMSNDRNTCLRECTRVLKPNGFIAIAYLNLHFAIYYLAKLNKFLTKDIITQISQPNVDKPSDFDEFIDISFLTTPPDIENEINLTGALKIVDHAGVDGINALISNELNQLTDLQWDDWCEVHYQTCREKSIMGLSSHGLLICQKL